MTIANKAASVTFDAVTKAFGPVVAVDRVSFTVEAGALVTLLGPSGCGKTTTLRMIAGLEMASAGRILIGDQDVTDLPATDRDVSMVFQSYALFPHMTVLENVSYGLRISGLGREETASRAHDGLELVGLKGFGDRLPSELSGGQQQRVAVARALVLEPQVLLFDEPLSNLDAKLRRRVREEIREIQQNLGLTSVYVTHDQEEALAVSDRIIVMNQAMIAQEGTPRELYEEPADLFVADFIGDANMVEAEILSLSGGEAEVVIGDIRLVLPGRGLPPGPVRVAIRPQAIQLSRKPGTPGAQNGVIEGVVRRSIYLGSHIEYSVETEIGEFFVVDASVASPIAPDTSVSVDFSRQGATLVRDKGP